MDNGQKTVRDLFGGTKIFRIPQYQRSYAWSDKQLGDFVDDIENQDLEKDYFFGTILFQERGRQGNFDIIDVVDGQQRITTLVIFMKLLLDRLRRKGEDTEILEETYIKYKTEYKLRILPQDNDFFRSYILQDNPIADAVISTPSQKRLLNAREYLQAKLEDYGTEQLRQFKDKIERTRVLTYSVVDTAEATLIFETTNDRGKSLTNLEKTKSFLMYKTYLAAANPDTQLDTIQQRFSQVYQDYEPIEKRIGEDTVLQYHFVAFEKWTNKWQYARYVEMLKRTVNSQIKSQDNDGAMAYIDKYSRELRESFAIVKSMLLHPGDRLQDIFAIARPANFYPLLIKSYKLDQSDDRAAFKRVARLVEIFTFRVYSIRRRRTNTGTEGLYRLARDFQGDFASLVSQLKQMIDNYCSPASFQSKLLSPSFYHDVRSTDINYLFWKYENYLRESEQPICPAMSYQEFANHGPKTKLSVEHIIPQTPAEMKVVEDQIVLPQMTQEFAEKYLHSLGNLTLDPQSANSSKSNAPYVHKARKYFRRAPFKTQNELDTFLNDGTGKWDGVSIESRRDKIIKFALAYWDCETV